MGRMLYANKTLLKSLKYQLHEIAGKTVHLIMPREIAKVHDVFWNRFKHQGVPSVLEQTRYLFVKGKEGYVKPF